MKKLIPVFLSVLIGCTSAYILYRVVETRYVNSIQGNAVAIQIGAFTREENAIQMSKNYGGIVYNDNGIYRVFYSILKSNENIDFITSYLKSSHINYYIKCIKLDDNELNKLDEYESLMERASEKNKVKVNTEILKSFKGSDMS